MLAHRRNVYSGWRVLPIANSVYNSFYSFFKTFYAGFTRNHTKTGELSFTHGVDIKNKSKQ